MQKKNGVRFSSCSLCKDNMLSHSYWVTKGILISYKFQVITSLNKKLRNGDKWLIKGWTEGGMKEVQGILMKNWLLIKLFNCILELQWSVIDTPILQFMLSKCFPHAVVDFLSFYPSRKYEVILVCWIN